MENKTRLQTEAAITRLVDYTRAAPLTWYQHQQAETDLTLVAELITQLDNRVMELEQEMES